MTCVSPRHTPSVSSSLKRSFCAFLALAWIGLQSCTANPPEVKNTQEETIPLLSPQQALEAWNWPEGFHVSLFASEPQIRQPISMTFDSRGRLWLAENDTYSDQSVGYDLQQHDRVIILEDTNHDGTADEKHVFWDKGQHLTSVELGFGGVWVLCAPDLLFIPDRDQNDIPDGEPEVMLTGFDNASIRHNIANGLHWGPDGWLYGRHGITTTSFVGTPETPEELRQPLNCSIWRFHPITRQFEVVCHGTTNSWGHDWDEHGELFFINTVIGHLWHGVPGAHFERMFGQDFNPHLYRLMPQTADHFHWDTSEAWSDIRKTGVTNTTDAAGGGHAHCGMMIYQGTNWPEEYRGDLFTLNLHGLRINRDLLEREGAGFVGRHAPDLAKTKDQWYRGVELGQGPDGAVYILDWSDIGECHDNDGIHRTSGRIYKVSYGSPDSSKTLKLNFDDQDQIQTALLSDDSWHHRMARRRLQESSRTNPPSGEFVSELKQVLRSNEEASTRLKALWGLLAIDAVDSDLILSLMNDQQENVRCWGLRLLRDQLMIDPSHWTEQTQDTVLQMAQEDSSGLVLTYIASLLQEVPDQKRLAIGAELVQRQEFRDDLRLPLMIWYGIEPAVAAYPEDSLALISVSEYPELNAFIARRITNESRQHPAAMKELIALAGQADDAITEQILIGVQAALEGRRRMEPPSNWAQVAENLANRQSASITETTRQLSVIFGDGQALDDVRKIAGDSRSDVSIRRNAIQSLVAARDQESVPLLKQLVTDRDLGVDAIRGLAVIGDEETSHLIISRFRSLRGHVQPVAIETLSSRADFAIAMLNAVNEGTIQPTAVTPFYLRQLRAFEDEQIQSLLQKLYPEWRHTSQEKEERANQLRSLLTSDRLKTADLQAGRAIFAKTCSSCHKLYGDGGTLGPELTGSQRSNLNYLIGNIVDPSAEVAEKFRMSIIALADGRVVSGVVIEESGETIKVQTPNELMTLLTEDIDARRNSSLSMMPERQLDKMTEEEIINLFGYLMSTSQVALP
ncbi:PVC-type heme-binding CxxCH protein [Thalassoglobus sp. JC818]|uniref:PVC-type heme-binding CxxCH protein n=1 Tax=Thalassoglobus sp. JC818 TaxID=3232136 RepID=UPI00345916A4